MSNPTLESLASELSQVVSCLEDLQKITSGHTDKFASIASHLIDNGKMHGAALEAAKSTSDLAVQTSTKVNSIDQQVAALASAMTEMNAAMKIILDRARILEGTRINPEMN